MTRRSGITLPKREPERPLGIAGQNRTGAVREPVRAGSDEQLGLIVVESVDQGLGRVRRSGLLVGRMAARLADHLALVQFTVPHTFIAQRTIHQPPLNSVVKVASSNGVDRSEPPAYRYLSRRSERAQRVDSRSVVRR